MIVLCRIWSKLNQFSQYEGAYTPLQENLSKTYSFSLSFKKGRQLIKPSLLILLLWCFAVTTVIVRQGNLSVPRWWELNSKTVQQNGMNHSRSIGFGLDVSEHHDKGGHHGAFGGVNSESGNKKPSRKKQGSEETQNGVHKISFQSAFSRFFGGMFWKKPRRFEGEDYFSCDRTHWRTNVCHLRGDLLVRDKLVTLRSRSKPKRIHQTEKIRPYPRKWEASLMENIEQVTIRQIYQPFSFWSTSKEQRCDAEYSVPAVVLSTGGYSGHIYHDFNDCLLPLFITAQHLKGEVVLLNLHYRGWWLHRYRNIVEQLSLYPVIDVERDNRSLCFQEVIVGLKIHDDMIVNSTLMPSGESIQNFKQILVKAFNHTGMINNLPLSEALQKSKSVQSAPGSAPATAKAPKLVLISRKESRVIENEKDIVNLAEQLGFQVEVVEPRGEIELSTMFQILQSCDVLMGVHGAALTHFLFMRPGSVLIQVVPLGTEWPSASFFGEPAVRSGLQYIKYSVKFQESSLSQKYNSSDPIINNPKTVISKGWVELRKTYLEDQNMTLSIPRVRKVFLKAFAKLSWSR